MHVNSFVGAWLQRPWVWSSAQRRFCQCGRCVSTGQFDGPVREAIPVVRTTTAATLSTSAAVLAEKFIWRMLMTRIKNAAVAALVALGMAQVRSLSHRVTNPHRLAMPERNYST